MRSNWVKTLSSICGCCANAMTWSVVGRACFGLSNSGEGPGSSLVVGGFSRCFTWTRGIDAVGHTPTHHESGGGCPTCPQGNVLLKQVHPGRSTKKSQLGRGWRKQEIDLPQILHTFFGSSTEKSPGVFVPISLTHWSHLSPVL